MIHNSDLIQKISLLLVSVICAVPVSGQYAFSLDGHVNDIAAVGNDKNGNIYLAGSFHRTVNFGGTGATFLLETTPRNTNAYIASYDKNGQRRFAFSLITGTTGNAPIEKMVVDENGNVFILGVFKGSVDFDPGSAEDKLHATEPTRFIAAYDNAGQLRFKYALDNVYDLNHVTVSLLLDGDGTVYLFSAFFGKIDFDPSAGTAYLTAAQNGSIAVSKLGNDGAFLSVARMIDRESINLPTYVFHPPVAYQFSFDVGRDGIIYVAGISTGVEDFDPTSATVKLVSGVTQEPYLFLSTYTKDGQLKYARLFAQHLRSNSVLPTYIYNLKAGNSGNIFISGMVADTVEFKTSSKGHLLTAGRDIVNSNMFLAAFDSLGEIKFAKKLDYETLNDLADESLALPMHMGLDADDNPVITGIFSGQLDFDPENGIKELHSINDQQDIFLCAYDSSGYLKYAHRFGTKDIKEEGRSLCFSENGDVFLAGIFQGDSMDVDPGTNDFFLHSYSSNTFIVGLDKDGNFKKGNGNPTKAPQLNKNPVLDIYPNPTSGRVEISLNGQTTERCIVELLTPQGIVASKTHFYESEKKTVNFSHLPQGVYIVRVFTNDSYSTQRLVIR